MFLQNAPDTEAAARLYQGDLDKRGFVMNFSRAWGWRPDVADAFLALRGLVTSISSLSPREQAVLTCAMASTLGDSYCSLAWGTMLAGASDPSTAAAVLSGSGSTALTSREEALAAWARKVVDDPNGTMAQDLDGLRAAGCSEKDIFEATIFIAFRLAFSTINDALGVEPDRQIAEGAPPEVRNAVGYGRPTEGQERRNTSSAC
jgi:alkylhydroperoxidase family enzyme